LLDAFGDIGVAYEIARIFRNVTLLTQVIQTSNCLRVYAERIGKVWIAA
jgi:hypothetical protein